MVACKAACLLVLAAVARAEGDDVTVLDDANFESTTQAATGQTTGKWFVEFYAPWCGHCKSLAGPWAELATKMKEQPDKGVLVAKVDATKNKKISKRFGVKGFPTLKFFADRKVYDYNGGRDVAAMEAFASGGYSSTEGAEVPAGPQWYHELIAKADPHLMDDVDNILKLRKTAAAILFIAGLVVGVVLTLLVCGRGGGNSAAPAEPQKRAKKTD